MSTQYDKLKRHLEGLEKYAGKLNGGKFLNAGDIANIRSIEGKIGDELGKLGSVLSEGIISEITMGVRSIRLGSSSTLVILGALIKKLK